MSELRIQAIDAELRAAHGTMATVPPAIAPLFARTDRSRTSPPELELVQALAGLSLAARVSAMQLEQIADRVDELAGLLLEAHDP